MKNIFYILVLFTFLNSTESIYYNKKLKPIKTLSQNKKNLFFKTEKGIVLGITNRIIIKLDNNQTINKCLNDFNLTKVKKIGKNLFLVKVSDNNKTLEVSNQLTNTAGITYAHPDFIKKRIGR